MSFLLHKKSSGQKLLSCDCGPSPGESGLDQLVGEVCVAPKASWGGGPWWRVVRAWGPSSLGHVHSPCCRSCGSWSIRSHPAKYLWSFPASAKCPKPSSICRPFLSFLKVNIALGERSEHAARAGAVVRPLSSPQSCGKSQGKGIFTSLLGRRGTH